MWQQGFTVILPVQMVSVQVEQIYKLYQQAMALKVKELHKGHQDHSKANTLLDKAARHPQDYQFAWSACATTATRTRRRRLRRVSDAEYLFLAAAISRARIVNELLPTN